MHGRMLMGYGASAPAFAIDAADFDGTDDMSKTTLTGQASTKLGIISIWFRPDTTTGGESYALFDSVDTAVGDDSFGVYLTDNTDAAGSRVISINAGSGTGSQPLGLGVDNTVNAWSTGQWHHVLASWDLGSGPAEHFYINDADVLFSSSSNDNAIRFNLFDEYRIGEFNNAFNGAGVGNFDGGLAEIYFAPGQYLDFSVEANRRKFITAGLKPVDLGATGATPTGSQPLVYQSLADGGAAATFATNKGSGGNWTIGGTLTTYASSPSD